MLKVRLTPSVCMFPPKLNVLTDKLEKDAEPVLVNVDELPNVKVPLTSALVDQTLVNLVELDPRLIWLTRSWLKLNVELEETQVRLGSPPESVPPVLYISDEFALLVAS